MFQPVNPNIFDKAEEWPQLMLGKEVKLVAFWYCPTCIPKNLLAPPCLSNLLGNKAHQLSLQRYRWEGAWNAAVLQRLRPSNKNYSTCSELKCRVLPPPQNRAATGFHVSCTRTHLVARIRHMNRSGWNSAWFKPWQSKGFTFLWHRAIINNPQLSSPCF